MANDGCFARSSIFPLALRFVSSIITSGSMGASVMGLLSHKVVLVSTRARWLVLALLVEWFARGCC